MTTDPRDVFRTIDASGIDADVLKVPVTEDEDLTAERQNIRGETLNEVETRDRALAETALLDAANQGTARVSDGATVDAGDRRLIVDTERVGYAVLWQDLTFGDDGLVTKRVDYVVVDPEAVR